MRNPLPKQHPYENTNESANDETYPVTRRVSASMESIARRHEERAEAQNETARAGANPSEEEIRMRAYEIYESRGGAPRDPAEDWIEAEQELRHRGRIVPRN